MSDTKLGQLIGPEARRDAIHIAIAPVTSGESILPGQHLALVEGSDDRVQSIGLATGPAIGIADPFLLAAVPPGQPFWLLLYPQTVTSLRHEWTHPAFVGGEAREWITAFAAKWSYSFDEFMAGAREYIQAGHLLDDKWEQLDISDTEWSVFWGHFQTLTGLSLGGKDAEFVSCCP